MKRRIFTWTVVLLLGIITGLLVSCGGGGHTCEAYGKANYQRLKRDHHELKSDLNQHKGKTEVPYRNK